MKPEPKIMTTIKDVENALWTIIDYKYASKWLKNDIIKMNIAKGYDGWMRDIKDHKMPLTLIEYVEYLLDTPEYFKQ